MSRLYFAYGANLNIENMRYRCPLATPVERFFLRDWKLMFCTHATIQPSPGDHVAGALWEITEECEKSLDYFEGYPVYYDKQYISYNNSNEIMIYVINSNQVDDPTPEYLSTIQQGYIDWDLPQRFLTQAIKDVDTHRYNHQWHDIEDDSWETWT